jgi:integrase
MQTTHQNQKRDLLNAYIEKHEKNTAIDYKKKLKIFGEFVTKNYDLTLDQLITTLTTISHGPRVDVYDLLSGFVLYLRKERSVSSLTIKLYMNAVRSFLETYDVEISARKFKLKVKMPRVIQTEKEALQKNDIQTILNACHNMKLKTYVLFLAATGCRAEEALSIRLCDLNFTRDPPTVFIRGEFTKTKRDRTVPLTQELAYQIKQWTSYKYRTRTVSYYDYKIKKTHVEKRKPKINNKVSLFSNEYRLDVTVGGLYQNMLQHFQKVLDRLGGKYAEFEPSGKRRKFTLHSFRRWVKTTISNLGHSEYSNYYIGHAGSTYYRVPQLEIIELFKKIEPYLTFLDTTSLERKGADLQSKLEAVEHENMELKSEFERVHDAYNETLVNQKEKEEDIKVLKQQVHGLISALGTMDQSSKNDWAKRMVKEGVYKKQVIQS